MPDSDYDIRSQGYYGPRVGGPGYLNNGFNRVDHQGAGGFRGGGHRGDGRHGDRHRDGGHRGGGGYNGYRNGHRGDRGRGYNTQQNRF